MWENIDFTFILKEIFENTTEMNSRFLYRQTVNDEKRKFKMQLVKFFNQLIKLCMRKISCLKHIKVKLDFQHTSFYKKRL